MAASARFCFVSSGSRAARRWISVRTADGSRRAAFWASVHMPSSSWIIPISRYVRASSSTMKATPSACACIVAALETLTFPPSTCCTNSAVSSCVNRSSLRRRTMPMRSMSAMSVTASLTSASFSARVASPRKMGRSESVRTM